MAVILVTGASRGIGGHLCRRLHDAGHRVFAGLRDPGAAHELEDLVGSDSFDVVGLDVRDERAARRAAALVVERAGRLDALVNNAGVAWLAPVELQSDALLRETLETNFIGAVRMIRAVLPTMRRQRSGKIINISSLAAFHGLPAEAAYCASKSALDAVAQSLALEVERFGISVTTIRPGYTRAGLATSDVAFDVPRDSDYEPVLRHLEALYAQSAESAESPDLIARAVVETLDSDAPAPRVELGELASAVAVMRQGDASEQLDAMRAVNALEWWRRGHERSSGRNMG